MADNIHPTAIIGENVKIGSNNTICENVIIEGNVTIGNDNYIGPFSHIANNVEIKDCNKFFGQISIGSLGEMGSKGDVFIEDGKVEIGSHNVFREFITVNSPVRKKATKIGNHCYFMARSHIPHDAIIMNNVVMATNSIIGGGVCHPRLCIYWAGLNNSPMANCRRILYARNEFCEHKEYSSLLHCYWCSQYHQWTKSCRGIKKRLFERRC